MRDNNNNVNNYNKKNKIITTDTCGIYTIDQMKLNCDIDNHNHKCDCNCKGYKADSTEA